MTGGFGSDLPVARLLSGAGSGSVLGSDWKRTPLCAWSRIGEAADVQAKLKDAMQIAFRALGLLLGVAGVGLGIWFFISPDYDGWYPRYVVPLAMVGTGAFFVHYGVTGRPRSGKWRGPSTGD